MRPIHAVLPILAALAASACSPSSAPGAEAVDARPSAVVALPEPKVSGGLEVHYLANEGFLIEGGGKRVLVDGLFGDGILGYPVVPSELRFELETGVGKWGDIQVVLATHHHGDHFDPGAVARFLEANRAAVFVSTPQAVRRLTAGLTTGDSERTELLTRVHGILPVEGAVEHLEISGIAIDLLNLHHGRRSPPVENLGLAVTLGDTRFLHFGDTEAKTEDFEPYLELLRGTDLAVLPFWFLSSEWRADMVRELIRPRWIVVSHMPTPNAAPSHFARWQSFENLIRVIETAFPKARLPRRPGEIYIFDDE